MLVEKPEAVVLCVALLVTCTAAQLGLNEEPRLRKRPRHFLHLRIQRTRDDLEHHVDCNVVCQDNSRDPVCGTNGQTFDSICDLDRDICRKVKVSLKHRGECSLAEKCLDERRAKQEQLANGESVYVPTCLADGSYAAVQCHNFTSYCWCSRLDGKPIPQTIQKERSPQCVEDRTSPPAPESPPQGKWTGVVGEEPGVQAVQTLMSLSTAKASTARPRPRPPQPGPKRCSGRTRKTFIDNMSHHLVKEFKRERNAKRMSEEKLLRKAVKWKFNRLDTDDDKQLKRREYRGFKKPVRKFIKPKKCAKKFPRLCDTDNNSILSEAEWMVCFLPTRKRGDQPSKCRNGSCRSSSPNDTRPKPSCNRDRQSILEAESAGNNSIPIPVCQPNGKYERVQCYRDICLCVDEWTGNSLDGTGVTNGTPDCSRPMPHAREWPGCTGETKTKFILDLKKFLFNKVEGGDRSTGADSTTQSVEEFAATYHFRNLDRNNNQFLEKKEKRLAKRFLKSNPKLKKCGRKITNYCDVDRDNKVSLEEWIACVVVVQNETEDPPRPPPQGSSNPFETILKSEA
ncbi:SPARC-related modular calcium-binding protein 2-like isoform X3 [Homarus americanus]|uniref:SPARC-related modular calcium-binding protein 2-like isoform X3 n=1 Tax=Homarus americanus TaxID=6706 RepID=UPI001C46793D|nr:SPARC-related modular calcium-binding protein 2-like isoform X3 [Homarus americanus]